MLVSAIASLQGMEKESSIRGMWLFSCRARPRMLVSAIASSQGMEGSAFGVVVVLLLRPSQYAVVSFFELEGIDC